jgi:glycosyltransferase involved in cell wall biosynthesis
VVGQGSATLPFGAAACMVTRTPFVYRSIGDPAFWASTATRRARVRVAVQRAQVVVAIWPGAADALVRLYRLPTDRVEVIPNGVPVDAFAPTLSSERPARRRALAGSLAPGLDPDLPLVGYVGALSTEKDPLLAVDALSHLPEAQLVVAGAGPLSDVVRARAEASERVHVVGAISDVAPLLAACDALVVSSRSEGIPAVAIEAGLAGLPVVACPVGGLPEVVRDGETGRLVTDRRPESLAVALRDVLDAAANQSMGAAARAHCVSHFGLDVVAERWVQLLARVGGTVR